MTGQRETTQICCIFTDYLFYDGASVHLLFLFLQLSFCFLHFVDEHLPHFFLFVLQLDEELLPLGFICFLEAEDYGGKNNVKLNLKLLMDTICFYYLGVAAVHKYKLRLVVIYSQGHKSKTF